MAYNTSFNNIFSQSDTVTPPTSPELVVAATINPITITNLNCVNNPKLKVTEDITSSIITNITITHSISFKLEKNSTLNLLSNHTLYNNNELNMAEGSKFILHEDYFTFKQGSHIISSNNINFHLIKDVTLSNTPQSKILITPIQFDAVNNSDNSPNIGLNDLKHLNDLCMAFEKIDASNLSDSYKKLLGINQNQITLDFKDITNLSWSLDRLEDVLSFSLQGIVNNFEE